MSLQDVLAPLPDRWGAPEDEGLGSGIRMQRAACRTGRAPTIVRPRARSYRRGPAGV